MTQLDMLEHDKLDFLQPKWMIVAFHKNGRTQYGKNRFDTEYGAHSFFKAMARIYPKSIKKISSYVVLPAKDSV